MLFAFLHVYRMILFDFGQFWTVQARHHLLYYLERWQTSVISINVWKQFFNIRLRIRLEVIFPVNIVRLIYFLLNEDLTSMSMNKTKMMIKSQSQTLWYLSKIYPWNIWESIKTYVCRHHVHRMIFTMWSNRVSFLMFLYNM